MTYTKGEDAVVEDLLRGDVNTNVVFVEDLFYEGEREGKSSL